MNLKIVILNERGQTKRVSTIWFYLFENLENAHLLIVTVSPQLHIAEN
jgi:hypothetical protein